jgi:hypothetical protein
MPPKSKSTPKDYDVKVKNWAKGLWSVISNEGKYNERHKEFFEEFKNLRDEAKAMDLTKVTMVNHVAPIYDHIASQGYTGQIHYQPLREAVANFCEGRAVADWKGPPDQMSPSPSPVLPPSPRPQSPRAGPSKKTKTGTSEVIVRPEHDYEKESPNPPLGDSIKVRRRTADLTKSDNAEGVDVPSMEGMELCATKCTLCASRKHGCHVNPKANKSPAACFECNHWRLKCSHAATRAKNEGDGPVKEPGPKRRKKGDDEGEGPKRRKKPIQVPAGQPAQIIGEQLLNFSDMAYILSLAESLAPDVLTKLENYESGRSLLLERIEELSQAIARLAAENRSMREWFMSRLQVLWENASQRDATTAETLKAILEHAVEMSRHVDLRNFGEKMEAFLQVPADVDPRQTRLSFAPPKIHPVQPKTTLSPRKRGAEIDPEVVAKRRKVGES